MLAPNFPEAAVFMARRGVGFDPEDTAVTRTESARQGLAESRLVAPDMQLRYLATQAAQIHEAASEDQVQQLLRLKLEDPMLGIYGSHLMLLNPERYWDLLRDLIVALRSLIGNHPDVIALTALPELKDLTGNAAFDIPPMLRNSWQLVVDGSASRPELVPLQSYAAAVANRTWGSGAWLVWRPPAARSAPLGAPAADGSIGVREVESATALLQQRIRANIRTLGARGVLRRAATDASLTDTERAILIYSISAVDQRINFLSLLRAHSRVVDRVYGFLWEKLEQLQWTDRFTGGLRSDPLVTQQLTSDRLVRALGVPLGSLNQAIVSLANKLAGDSR